MADRVLIDVMDARYRDAGTKARNDVRDILEELGFQTTVMFNRSHNNVLRLLEVLAATGRMGRGVGAGELVVLQYPYHPQIMALFGHRMAALKRKRDCRYVILVHDVLYLRDEGLHGADQAQQRAREVGFFNQADALIVHNEMMKSRLAADGVTRPMVCLGVFDYLYDGVPARVPSEEGIRVVFAGNLTKRNKSGFLRAAPGGVTYELYGNQPQGLPACCHYNGSYPPDELIAHMEGHYGLVWDGPSAETCEGNYGAYLRYNDPHKLSLYLAAGLPVVVWHESALAGFVAARGVGVCVDSLTELAGLPAQGSLEYARMRENVEALSGRLRRGAYLLEAIDGVRAALA